MVIKNLRHSKASTQDLQGQSLQSRSTTASLLVGWRL